MIDDKKIEEATRDYIDKNGYLNKYDEEPCVDIEFAYKDGAKWAINEFLKDLWHPNTEEPDKSKSDIITLGFYDDAYLQFKESIIWNRIFSALLPKDTTRKIKPLRSVMPHLLPSARLCPPNPWN